MFVASNYLGIQRFVFYLSVLSQRVLTPHKQWPNSFSTNINNFWPNGAAKILQMLQIWNRLVKLHLSAKYREDPSINKNFCFKTFIPF